MPLFLASQRGHGSFGSNVGGLFVLFRELEARAEERILKAKRDEARGSNSRPGKRRRQARQESSDEEMSEDDEDEEAAGYREESEGEEEEEMEEEQAKEKSRKKR
eukprot:scaffold240337_cov35-Prasinocladus_malaysianus.AAC.2